MILFPETRCILKVVVICSDQVAVLVSIPHVWHRLILLGGFHVCLTLRMLMHSAVEAQDSEASHIIHTGTGWGLDAVAFLLAGTIRNRHPSFAKFIFLPAFRISLTNHSGKSQDGKYLLCDVKFIRSSLMIIILNLFLDKGSNGMILLVSSTIDVHR